MRILPDPIAYPLLAKHKVHLITSEMGPAGVDKDDFIRALKERRLWKWFNSELRVNTVGANGLYPHDAEAYLNKKVYEI